MRSNLFVTKEYACDAETDEQINSDPKDEQKHQVIFRNH